MDCPSCSQENPEDATFCSQCNHPLLAERIVANEVSSLARLAGSVFVGREREINELRAVLEDVLAGRGRLLLLVGEPGIGKTRLADEFAETSHRRGARVLRGRCWEGEGAPAFWPWVQIVRSYVHNRDPKVLMSEMGSGATDIAQVVPEVQKQVSYLPTPPALEPEQARFRFFDSLTTFFKNAGKRQPLVLILDDLHWADKPSLLFLQFLALELRDAHLLVVGTYRDIELGRQHPLSQTLGELVRERASQRVLLRGLTEQDVARFIEITADLKPPKGLVTAIYKETEGNPFFVNEIVRLLVADGRLEPPEEVISWSLTIPQSVREVIGRRLNHLSEECNHVLTTASVIGREFSLEALKGVSSFSSDRLLEVLEEAMAARVVTDVPHAVGRYRFSHNLIRETLYEELTIIRRIRLHRQVGEVLEGLYGANPEPHLAELAHHFFQAAPGGDVDKAIKYEVRAGERAAIMLAYEEAVNHYERALQALELKEPRDELQRCELLLALGDAQRRAGDTPKARETFRRASNLARKLGVPEHLARATLGFGGEWGESGIVDEPLVSLLEETLDALGEGDSALRARMLARLAQELHFSAAFAERKASLSQQAVEMARRVGDTAALTYALNSRHWTLWGPENVEERLAVATEMVRLAEGVGDREIALQGRHYRLADLLELGDISAVDEEIQAYAQLAEELRQPLYLWLTLLFRAMRALLAGRFEESERLGQQALAIGQRVRVQTAAQVFGMQMFELCREQGRLQELEATVKGFVDQYPTIPAWRSVLACLYSELGREAEAQAEFEYLAANDFAALPRDQNWLIGITFLSQVCAFLRNTQRAETLYKLLLPYAGRNVVGARGLACCGSASHYLGLLAATISRWEEAAQHFEDALTMNTKMGARPWLVHTQHEYATMLLAHGQPDDPTGSGQGREKALKLLNQALATAQKLGMKSLAEKATVLRKQVTEDGEGRLRDTEPVVAEPIASPPPVSREKREITQNLFRKEGEYWTIGYEGRVFRLRDAKGLHYIAYLLRHPGREFHAADLVVATEKQQLELTAKPYGRMSEEQLAEQNLSVSGLGDAGDMLDSQAKAAYKRRLDDLREELAEAERFNDPVQAAKAQEEIDFLTNELAAAYGLGGRARKGASSVEKVRKAVTNRIRESLAKIKKEHPSLWQHLFNALKTGTFCSYIPEKPTPWQLS